MFWIPWIEENPPSITMEYGDRVLTLSRFKINDAQTVSRRDKRANDLVMYQHGRPRPQSYSMEFGPYKKDGDLPPEWNFPEFKRLVRQYPGWIAILTFPDGTNMHGIINDPVYKEVGDCQMLIQFNFDILRDFPFGEVPVWFGYGRPA